MDKHYFPNLNGLRFIGALMVIIGHIEFIKSLNGIPNLMKIPFYSNTSGHLGVILFFVLSGFLITYLLLVELDEKKTINLRNFYVRRILRIWPLYFFIVVISIFIMPFLYPLLNYKIHLINWLDMRYYIFFLPNLAKASRHYIDGLVHLWSVGVEEQFYLIWPVLILLFKKYILYLFLTLFFGVTCLPFILDYINVNSTFFVNKAVFFTQLKSFIVTFKINLMALGGIFAYAYHKKKSWFIIFQNNIFQLLITFFTICFWLSGSILTLLNDEVYAIFFAVIIYSYSTSKKAVVNLENKWFNFFGSISYGLYVYHWIVILSILYFLKIIFPNYEKNLILFNMLLYFTSIILTIFISHLSYSYFEKPFLKIKERFNR